MVTIEFHSFTMGDSDDPEIYAAEPLSKFLKTEKGQWVKEHCSDPRYVIRPDFHTYGHRVVIYGTVEDISATEYYLRWSNVE